MMSIFLTFYFVHIFKNASVIFKTLKDEPVDPFGVFLRISLDQGKVVPRFNEGPRDSGIFAV